MILFNYEDVALSLSGPDLGNTENVILNNLFKRAMDGTVYSFINPLEDRELSYSVTNINRPKAIELISFVQNSQGKNVRHTDHNGDNWIGKFTQPTISTVHQGIHNNVFNLVFFGRRL
jgi:hypothetical protein